MSKQVNLYTIDFSQFTPENLSPLFEKYKASALAEIEQLVAKGDQVTIEDLFGENNYDHTLNGELNFAPAWHLSSVADNAEYREKINEIIPKASELSLQIMQNEDMYKIYQRLHDAPEFATYSEEIQSAIKKSLIAYRNSGVSLTGKAKEEFKKVKAELSELTTKYSNNLLDARQAWSKLITNKEELAGVPESALELLQFYAKQKDLEGYLLTLDPPAMLPILQYCKNRELRKEVNEAYGYLASPYDSTKGKFDNTEIAQKIYECKQKLAKLLGYKNYAELSLSTKMADTPEQVLTFLKDLRDRSIDKARAAFEEIKQFAKDTDGIEDFQQWDFTYYKNQLGMSKYALDPEEIRKYFPADKVLSGLFEVVEKLYGLKFEVDESVKTYDPEVKFLRAYENGKLVAGCYVDMYARTGKRSGAWMDEAFGRCETETRLKLPVAYVNGNFNPPVNGKQATLTHDEVETLFHEMGHALHLLLTKTKVQEVCGTSVEWDAVELPSQINENWVYQLDSLKLISRHVETGETIPEALVEKIKDHAAFERGALFITRQLEFGLFDMELFSKPETDTRTVKEVYLDVYDSLTRKILGFDTKGTFPNTFSHIFAGGYTAGYYSYLWADVLAHDAFAAYEEAGDIFDNKVATAFKENILATGSTRPSMINYEKFRGRKPNNDALLRGYGLLD